MKYILVALLILLIGLPLVAGIFGFILRLMMGLVVLAYSLAPAVIVGGIVIGIVWLLARNAPEEKDKP